MNRTTKYSNDLIRNKAVNILRKLGSENGLDGDELAIISSFCLIERVENKQLKEYEDLEEQMKLPCAVGDTVYYRYDGIKIAPMRVEEIIIVEYGINLLLAYCGNDEGLKYWKINIESTSIDCKIVFLTREEAEAVLEELMEWRRMSNDLISRSALMQSLRGNVLVDVTPNLEQAIAEQPTAYDVDKVVDWLETNSMYVGEEIEAVVTLADAIEIVRSGGIE